MTVGHPDGEADSSFDLRDRAWVPVRLLNGSSAELSLRETFHRAAEIRDITGELPVQGFAILRLLLAIFYRSRGDAFILDDWLDWKENGLPLGDLDAYLDEFPREFDVFDAERPFFQVADLATAKGDWKDAAPLILDLPSNNRLFTNRSGDDATTLSPSEAARWLVTIQSFDPSGIRSGALGDDRVKGGKGYPIGLAWSGLLGGVYAQGATLAETLLLNLVAPDHGVELDFDADLPPWEDDHPDSAAERIGLLPHGPVRLYTWQSRRVRLVREGSRVIGCLVANGDKLTPQNMSRLEPMTAWRYSEPQSKTAGQPTYMPREHLPQRALWRGIASILPGIAPVVPKKNLPAAKEPGLVTWLAELEAAGMLTGSERLRLRSVGVVYGSNNSVVDEVLDDDVVFPLSLLRERNRELAAQAEHAVTLADEGARAVRQLAENLERAAGGDGTGAGLKALTRAYSDLDRPYRNWLKDLDDQEMQPLAALDRWKVIARAVLATIGAELVAQAPPAAWAGREVRRLGGSELITTARAEGWFRLALDKTFGNPLRKDAE